MNLVIDNSNLIVGGGIQVGTSFLNDLKKINLDYQYHVIQSSNSLKEIDKSMFPINFHFYDLNEDETKSISKRIKRVKEIENLVKPKCIFTVFGPSYHKSNYPKIVGFAIPYLIYPDSPFFKNISLLKKIKYYFLSILKRTAFKKNSDILIFETENARNIFSKKIKNKRIKTYTVNNTINEIFLNKDKWEKLQYDFPNTFNILCLTSNYPHKNIDIIPRVIDILKEKFGLSNFKFLITLEKCDININNEYDDYIEYLGKVPLINIPDLYNKSNIAFIPTLLEVFSATYLESMFMGIPIISSDMPFARDICEESAIYCSPIDPLQYAEAIYNLSKNSELYEDLVKKGKNNLLRFGGSMDRTKQYIDIIKRTIEDNTFDNKNNL